MPRPGGPGGGPGGPGRGPGGPGGFRFRRHGGFYGGGPRPPHRPYRGGCLPVVLLFLVFVGGFFGFIL